MDAPIAKALQEGNYDYLFDSKQPLSEMFRESLQPPRSPIVALVAPVSATPASPELPQYPPIARAAHVSGKVIVTFEVTAAGRTEDVAFTSGPEMLRNSVKDALAKWVFPESASSHQEQATFDFNLNCNDILINSSLSAQHQSLSEVQTSVVFKRP